MGGNYFSGASSLLDMFFSLLVPAPKQLTLERQLNKSVLIGWNAPSPEEGCLPESYHVYVDGNLKTTIKATERTRALVEGVDSNKVSGMKVIENLSNVILVFSYNYTTR